MGMLATVFGNLLRPARTRAPADTPAIPPNFRGALTHDPARCTACGTCAFVCAPRAIGFAARPDNAVAWRWEIGRCSFCGLCEQNCPTRAIGNTGASAHPVIDEEVLESLVTPRACTRCGRPHFPLPADLAAFGADDGLCPDCRERATGARLRRAFLGGDRP